MTQFDTQTIVSTGMSQQSPDNRLLTSQSVPLSKPKPEDKNREIDHIARQLKGLSDRLKRLKEQK